MIENRHIQHIIALAEHMSFAKAALSLNISQPALTASIQKAESLLGERLFDRTKRSVKVTPFGEVVISKGKQALVSINGIQHEFNLMNNNTSGCVNIGISAAAADLALEKIMLSMLEKYPGINNNFEIGVWADFEEKLKSGDIDIYIGPTESSIAQERFDVVQFNEFNGWFYCRTGHPILQKSDISIDDILQYQIALFTLPPLAIDKVLGTDNNMRQQNFSDNSGFQNIFCDNHSFLRSVVSNSNAIGLTILTMAEQLLEEGRVVPIMKDSPRITSSFGATTVKYRTQLPVVKSFIDCVQNSFTEIHKNELELMKKYSVSAP